MGSGEKSNDSQCKRVLWLSGWRGGKAAVERKEKLGARDEDAKERCMKIYKEKRKLKKWGAYQSKKELINILDVDWNRKSVWKEVSKVKGEKWRVEAE